MIDPDWDVPAKLDGLPVRHWKRRTGFTERGTVAQMVERWLRLAWSQQQGCSLAWGAGRGWEARRMAGERHRGVRASGWASAADVSREIPAADARRNRGNVREAGLPRSPLRSTGSL